MPDQDSEEEKDIDKYYVETKMETTKDFFWSLKHRNQNRKHTFILNLFGRTMEPWREWMSSGFEYV